MMYRFLPAGISFVYLFYELRFRNHIPLIGVKLCEKVADDMVSWGQRMNGRPIREMDKIICPVCKRCRDHERFGFVEGIKVGILLKEELTSE